MVLFTLALSTSWWELSPHVLAQGGAFKLTHWSIFAFFQERAKHLGNLLLSNLSSVCPSCHVQQVPNPSNVQIGIVNADGGCSAARTEKHRINIKTTMSLGSCDMFDKFQTLLTSSKLNEIFRTKFGIFRLSQLCALGDDGTRGHRACLQAVPTAGQTWHLHVYSRTSDSQSICPHQRFQ